MDKILSRHEVRDQSDHRDVNRFLVFFNHSESKSKIKMALASKVRIRKILSTESCFFSTCLEKLLELSGLCPEIKYVLSFEEGLVFNLRASKNRVQIRDGSDSMASRL